MNTILLIGAALNLTGGIGILLSMAIKIPFTFPVMPSADTVNPSDYALHRLFTSGTAFTFASMYVYLYLHPEYVMPFIVFGMALKYWAFAASLVSFIFFKLPKDILINFGFSNLTVALLFTYYLVNL
jgi:hypothetical protein